MKKALGWIAGLLALSLLIVGAYFLYGYLSDTYLSNPSLTTPTDPPVQTDNPDDTTDYSAPEFTVFDWNGNPVSLSQLKGRPIVLNFWASWCPPCKAEMPDFEKMYLKYGDQVVFMMVNMTDGSQETLATAKAHIEKEGYTFPVYFDTNMQAAYAYYVTSLPQTFFIDKNGDLYTYYPGMITEQQLEKLIEMILP